MASKKFLQIVILFGLIINNNCFILGSANKENEQCFSVYNTNWNGCSSYREAIESRGFEVMSINSSLSAFNRLDKSICLILLGPNKSYDPIYDVPFFCDFFNDDTKKNSLFIAHDYSSSCTLLWDIFIANLLNWQDLSTANIFPAAIIADGILRDNESCLKNPLGEGDSSFPIITEFDTSHPTTSNVSQVILSVASAAAGGKLFIESTFGWDIIGSSSLSNSFVDTNGNKVYDYDPDMENFADSIDLTKIAKILYDFGFPGFENQSDFLHFPLGSSVFAPAVFLAKELQNNRIYLSSDASCFSNDLINRSEYDNLQFGLNIIDWLTYNGIDDPDDWIIVFDESRVRPEDSGDSISAGNIIIISVVSLISVILIVKRLRLNNQP